MKSHELERWTLQVIDQVKAGRPVEDSRVELKATWIEPTRAARRLAGHANASGGGHILWIVGVDEKAGVVGADRKELSAWWAGVQAEFEGLPPELVRSINVPVHDKAVVSLLFEADRVPFVVRNPALGVGKCPVELEVPWRTATGTRSARRSDLARLLSSLQELPHMEVLSASLAVTPELEDGPFGPVPSTDPQFLYWDFSAQAYVVPRSASALVIPFHRSKGTVHLSELGDSIALTKIALGPATSSIGLRGYVRSRKTESISVESTAYEVYIKGPGMLEMNAQGTSEPDDLPRESSVGVTLRLSVVDVDAPVVVHADLSPAVVPDEHVHELARWEMRQC